MLSSGAARRSEGNTYLSQNLFLGQGCAFILRVQSAKADMNRRAKRATYFIMKKKHMQICSNQLNSQEITCVTQHIV